MLFSVVAVAAVLQAPEQWSWRYAASAAAQVAVAVGTALCQSRPHGGRPAASLAVAEADSLMTWEVKVDLLVAEAPVITRITATSLSTSLEAMA